MASFFDDERLQRIFSFQSMYAGLAPYEALALYAVITYMDSVEGVFVPEGGMHMMASGLAAAVEQGRRRHPLLGTGHLDHAARRTVGSPASNSADGEHVAADAVVCNADLPVAYRELLPGVTAPACRPHGQVLAVVPAVGRRRAGSSTCRMRRITTSISGTTGTVRSRR